MSQVLGKQLAGALDFVAAKATAIRALLASAATIDAATTSLLVERNGSVVLTLAPKTSGKPELAVEFLRPSARPRTAILFRPPQARSPESSRMNSMPPQRCAANKRADGCFDLIVGFTPSRAQGCTNGTQQGFTYDSPPNTVFTSHEDVSRRSPMRLLMGMQVQDGTGTISRKICFLTIAGGHGSITLP